MEHSLDHKAYPHRRIALLNVKRVQMAARVSTIAVASLGALLLMLLK